MKYGLAGFGQRIEAVPVYPEADCWGVRGAGPQRTGLSEIKPRERGWLTSALEGRRRGHPLSDRTGKDSLFGLCPYFPTSLYRKQTVPQLHGEGGEALLRGDGAPRVKSEPLLFVSTHPPPARVIAVVLLSRAAAVPSAKVAVPYPTRSTICGSLGADPLSKGDPETRATFPDAALSPIPPAASGAGSWTPAPDCPVPSWIK